VTLLLEAPQHVTPTLRHPHGDGALQELAESGLVFLVSLVLFFTVAMLLDFKYRAFEGDAIARMANGFYVLHSRDPHLGAIGFVWNPLSSLADLPLLSLNSLWPTLASHNVVGTTMSALAMACASYQLHAILREWKLARLPRLVLTAFFVVNPMILLFGGNGMSEAAYLFTMVAATRYLLRWLRAGDPASLWYCALALAFGYLERIEPIGAAALATPLVFWVAFARSGGEECSRVRSGLRAVSIVLTPIVATFLLWAAICWAVVGQLFPQFTSKYGNANLVASSHAPATTTAALVWHEIMAMTSLSPLLALILSLALVVAVRRRDIQLLGVIAVLGGGLAFTLLTYAANALFPWYRYFIMVVPLEVLLVGSLFSVPSHLRLAPPTEAGTGPWVPARRSFHERAVGLIVAGTVSMLLLVPSVLGTASGMDDMSIAPDIVYFYGFIYHHHLDPQDMQAQSAYAAIRSIADYMDDQHFPNGDVVVDSGDNCIPNVVTNVDNPRMFVIPNDPDFQRVLDHPLRFRARYLLVQGSGSAQTDAVGQRYPNLGSGDTWATLVHVFPPKGLCVTFRLFRLTGSLTKSSTHRPQRSHPESTPRRGSVAVRSPQRG